MSTLRLALRFARRELRSGLSGFRIFLAALTFGVAAIAGVGSLGQSFLAGLSDQGRTLLGGDVGLSRPYRPASPEERAFMARFGHVSEFASLRSMAAAAGRSAASRTLIELKAVDAAYPLVGAMTLSPAMDLSRALTCGPTRCGAVVESALLERLGLSVGDLIHVGDADFIVRAQIVSEPDRVARGFELGPQVMISLEALRRAGLVIPGSLIGYSYRIALARGTSLEDFRSAEKAAFPAADWRLTDRTNAVPQATRFIERASMFLTLVALAALIVGGVGAGQAVGAFLERRRDGIATLKAMGATGEEIVLIYLVQILAVAALALGLGLVLGAALPFAVGHLFGSLIPVPAHYALYPGPLALAAAFGLMTALGFALIPLARAREVSPASLFRDLIAPAPAPARLGYRAAAAVLFAGIAVLSIAVLPYPRFTSGFLAGALLVLGALRLAAFGVQRGFRHLTAGRSQAVRLALANLVRPAAPTSGIVVALGLGLTLFATVTLIEASMNAQIEDELPGRVPSFVFLDVQESEIDAFRKLVSSIPTAQDLNALPMLRARIVKLNGRPVDRAKIDPSARWVLNGDHGLTYAGTRLKDLRIVEGPGWWPADYRGPSLLSFDGKLAQAMHLKIGDTITVNIAGRDVDLTLYNLRDTDYRGAGGSFVFIVSPGLVDKAPHTFIADLRVGPSEEEALFSAVSKAYPNITIVNVKDALHRVGEMLALLAHGVEAASLVSILAGVLVLAGAIAAGHRARLYDAVMLKVLGATRARLALIYVIEYGILGAIAGIAALAAGILASWIIVQFVLDIPLVVPAKALVLTVLGSMAGTLALGLAAGFAALSARPARLLSRA